MVGFPSCSPPIGDLLQGKTVAPIFLHPGAEHWPNGFVESTAPSPHLVARNQRVVWFNLGFEWTLLAGAIGDENWNVPEISLPLWFPLSGPLRSFPRAPTSLVGLVVGLPYLTHKFVTLSRGSESGHHARLWKNPLFRKRSKRDDALVLFGFLVSTGVVGEHWVLGPLSG